MTELEQALRKWVITFYEKDGQVSDGYTYVYGPKQHDDDELLTLTCQIEDPESPLERQLATWHGAKERNAGHPLTGYSDHVSDFDEEFLDTDDETYYSMLESVYQVEPGDEWADEWLFDWAKQYFGLNLPRTGTK